ncbi:restriction endonuclease subunit S [Paraclostridium sordellii]|uniref:restriction endonuclease subunit S n=1 Tax=Paraclostridium sordellii TaxID=1505 RepID=UPI0005DB4C95|nr:restriction endonuclease subunit S [Paeniclostridium sordellii]CEO26412.1 type IC HsdS subunit [[Clostridium] sordellii] [Paeniclostridium sordellii]
MNKTPKLRFKEFSGEWEVKKLGCITTKVGSGKTPKGGNSVYTNSGVMFLRSQNVLKGKLNLNDVAYISEEINATMKSTEVHGDDILLNITGASIGRSCNVPKDFPRANVNQHVCIIRLNENYNSNFIMNQIVSSKVQKQIDSYQAGGNREGLNFEQIKNMKVSSTSIEEQEKIASFFSLIDDKISLQSEKVEALKDYKKGMMQKIFSRELRFKDDEGRSYSEWEDNKLGKLIYEPLKLKEESPESQELLTVKLHCLGIESTGKYPNSTKNGRPYYKRFNGELLIGRQNLHNGGIGIVSDKCNGLIASNAISSYLSKEGVNIGFIYYTISRSDYYKKIDLLIGGTGQKEISKKELENLSISIPSLEEQNKIVEFLRNLDIKLVKEQEKLNSLNEYKRGLLQQMFV